MSGSEADPNAPRDSAQLPVASQFSAPLLSSSSSVSHGSPIADFNALQPALTPATTTRQSVALPGWSPFWESNITPTINAQPILFDSSVPAILTHAPPLDTAEAPVDLAASTGSVPSTTTTLTNTLPPTQSAALRALNAPAFHSSPAKSKPAKSTSSHTTVTSQPVVVRTYSGSRHNSRPGSGFSTPRSFAMNAHTNASALSASLAGKSDRLPSAEDFSFSAILRAVDPEIRDAIDAIAEICARSRMSLADEYEAHLPPQGEITGAGPGWASTGALAGRGRLSRVTQGWTAADNTLMAVPEASSSSERLAQEGKIGSSRRRSQSAYGSLKSVISGGSGKRKATDGDTYRDQEDASSTHAEGRRYSGPAWAVHASSSTHPSITLMTSPKPSKQLDTSSGLDDVPEEAEAPLYTTTTRQRAPTHRRGASHMSPPSSRPRPGTLSSISSWLSWPRPPDLSTNNQQELTRAEARLREMLQISSQNLGKGKAPVSVV